MSTPITAPTAPPAVPPSAASAATAATWLGLRALVRVVLAVVLTGGLLGLALVVPAPASATPRWDWPPGDYVDVPPSTDVDRGDSAIRIWTTSPRLDHPVYTFLSEFWRNETIPLHPECSHPLTDAEAGLPAGQRRYSIGCWATHAVVPSYGDLGQRYLATDQLGAFTLTLVAVVVDKQTRQTVASAEKDYTYTVIDPPTADDEGPSDGPDPEPADRVDTSVDVKSTPLHATPGVAGSVYVELVPTDVNGPVTGLLQVVPAGAPADAPALATEELYASDDSATAIGLPVLPVGTHTLEVRYLGSSAYHPAESGVVPLVVQHPSTTEVQGGPFEAELDETLTVPVHVESEGPLGGDVVVTDSTGAEVGRAATDEGGDTVVRLAGGALRQDGYQVRYTGNDETAGSTATFYGDVQDFLDAGPDTFYVAPGEATLIEAPGVLANDVAVSGDDTRLYADFKVPPSHGSGWITPDGGVSYTPEPGFVGTDRMVYVAKDFGLGGRIPHSKHTTVTIVVGDTWLSDAGIETRPYGGGWQAVDPDDDLATVVDGNPTRFTETLRNPTATPVSLEVRAVDAGGSTLPGSTDILELAPFEEVEHTTTFSTRGWAWTPDGDPALAREVKLRVKPSGHPAVVTTRRLTVDPLPVVLVHGYSSYAAKAWGTTGNGFDALLHDRHPGLRGYAVGDGQVPGTMNTGDLEHPGPTGSIASNAEQEALYVEGVRELTGAHHVDLVAHSMGGLISRRYVQDLMPLDPDGGPVVRHLVQVGTPNTGSPCADLMMEGSAATGHYELAPQPATLELTTRAAWAFNFRVTDLRGTELSNLVGTGYDLPCGPGDSDLIVPVDSARWTIPRADLVERHVLHTDMTADAGVVADYVVPRLADADGNARAGRGTGRVPAAQPESASTTFDARVVRLSPSGTNDVALDVPAGSSFGVTGFAAVGLTLIDPQGQEVEHGTALDTSLPFVGVSTTGQVPGAWTVRLMGEPGAQVPLIAWVAGDAVRLDTPSATVRPSGEASVSARIAGVPAGTKLTATVTDGSASLVTFELFDDGEHGDGQAGDDVHASGPVALPTTGTHLVTVTATLPGGGHRYATTALVPADPDEVQVPAPPAIIEHPHDVRAAVGETAVFAVTGAGEVESVRWEVQRAGTTHWQPIAGAGSASLVVPLPDRTLDQTSVRAILVGPGGEAVSTPASLRVARAAATVRAHYRLTPGRAGRVHVAVRAHGIVPSGRVVVREGRRVIARAVLDRQGTAVVRLPRLHRGRHLLVVRYRGSALVSPATSPATRVRGKHVE